VDGLIQAVTGSSVMPQERLIPYDAIWLLVVFHAGMKASCDDQLSNFSPAGEIRFSLGNPLVDSYLEFT
jgi:hypothetical protein